MGITNVYKKITYTILKWSKYIKEVILNGIWKIDDSMKW